MSEGRPAATAAARVGSGAGRLARAWRGMPQDRRLAAFAASGLFLTLFLPWYQETVVVASASKKLVTASQSLTGWAAFSFVEAAVLVVALGVLTLLFQRAEGRAFHLPGGDGWVITAAGAWSCLLVVWRIFDKQGTSNQGQVASSSGIEWGIFIALLVAASLTYAGSRIRAAHQPEPPLPGEDGMRVPGGSPGEDLLEPQRMVRPPGRASAEPAQPTHRRPAPQRPRGWLSASRDNLPVPAEQAPAAELPAERAPAEQLPAEQLPPTPESERRPGPDLPVPAEDAPTAAMPERSHRPARNLPVPSEDAPTAAKPERSHRPGRNLPVPAEEPPTQATRPQQQLDDQLTIPLESED